MLKNEADRRGALIGEEGDLGEARGPNESIGSGGSFWLLKPEWCFSALFPLLSFYYNYSFVTYLSFRGDWWNYCYSLTQLDYRKKEGKLGYSFFNVFSYRKSSRFSAAPAGLLSGFHPPISPFLTPKPTMQHAASSNPSTHPHRRKTKKNHNEPSKREFSSNVTISRLNSAFFA